ncbi:MAG: ATP-binding protein [Sandaracinaceae bacterium]
MKLRVVAVVLVAALVPVGVVGSWLRMQTFRQAQEENTARLESSTTATAARVQEQQRRERRAVARLCDGDILVDRLMLDLEAARFGPLEQDELVSRLPHLMRSMGLVALQLIDGRNGSRRYGQVFAAGHFAGRAGADERELARAVEDAGERWFVQELRIREDGETRDVQALLTGCVAERGEARIIAVGGQVLDDAFVQALDADVPPVQLLLRDADDASTPEGAAPRPVHVFEDSQGAPAARLIAVVDDGPLQARMREFDRTLWLAIGGSLVLALILGLALALGMARPLTELEGAADRVGAGDMNTMITINSGGEVGKALGAFNQMVKNLNDAQRKLIRAERIAAWRDIARRIAHEIKNPLTPIKMSIETMQKVHARKHPDFDEIFEESTTTILEEVDRLQRIVTEFSKFARMPRPRPVELSVVDVVRHVVGLHTGGEVDIQLEGDGEPMVRADREQLTQVLVNLVQNACDAAKARHGGHGAEVRVIVEPDGDGARVRVVDNGPGIPHEEKSRVFEPYYTTKSGGTGLGLAIVHRIVSDHGGTLEIDDTEGGGATFEIVLTRTGPPMEATTTAADATVMPLVQRRDG